MNKPLVSVVMVTCNVDRFLVEAIDSILDQSFSDFEFVIVDFGSTDKSHSIILEYAAKDGRIKFHTIPHCRLPEARNAACRLAQGRYMAIMDADDVAIKDRLLWQVDFMEKHPEIGLLGGAFEWTNADGKPYFVQRNPIEDGEIRSGLAEGRTLIHQPTALMRSEAFGAAGGYRAAFSVTQDYDLWCRIGERFQLANLSEVVLKYRIHPNQISLRKMRQQTLNVLAAQASVSLRKRHRPDPLNSVEEITPAVLAEMGVSEARQETLLARHYLGWIRTMSMMGEDSAALDAAREMLGSCDWKHAESSAVADMRLMVARLYWRQKQYLRGLATAGHAVIMRPIVAGRPMKSLLRWLGLFPGTERPRTEGHVAS